MTTSAESSAEPEAALIDFRDARIATAGGSIGASLDARASGASVALIGRFSEVFALLGGQATLSSGTARVLGVEAEVAVRSCHVGLALRDPLLPERWSARRFLEESALLGGLDRRAAGFRVERALARFELAAMARRKLGELALLERRALVLAAATLCDPPVLCAEAPLARLDPVSQGYVERVLARAAEHRRLIVSIPELPPAGSERALADAQESRIIEGGRSAATALGGERSCVVSLATGSAAFCAALVERGATYSALELDPILLGLVSGPSPELCRLRVALPESMSASDVFALASALDATVIELAPSA